MIKAIFFDLDGVLVDFCDLHYHALNTALFNVCKIKIPYNEHLTAFDGLSTRQKLIKLQDQGRIEARHIPAIRAEKQAATIVAIKEQVKPDPVKIALCRGLEREGFILCCVSNCVLDSVYAFLAGAGIMDYFYCTVSNESVNNPKPAPDPYLQALEACGVKTTEVLAFEDNVRGVTSAQAANVPVIQITYSKVNLSTIRRFIYEFRD